MNTHKSLIAASLAVLFLAACGSSGGMGDIFGGGSDNNQASYEIRGIVDSVDTNSRSVYLTNVSGLTNMLSNSGSGGTARVYFDAQTPVEYNGQTYRPEDLERGDEVSIRVDESGNRLMAERMTVLRDVSSGSSSTYPSGTYGSTVRGTVRYIDTARRTIDIDRGVGSTMVVEYDTATPVYFNNQTFRVGDLERGDEIEVRVRDLGSNRLLAQDITVTRNVSGGTFGGSTSSSNLTTLRGTVNYVDTNRRTIELSSPSWISNFNSGAGSSGLVTISYDTNVRVDVGGRLHPVANLERGDVVEVHVRDLGGSTFLAQRIILVRDVNAR